MTLRPPQRVCSICSAELAIDNRDRAGRCLECKVIDRSRQSDLIERGKQLALDMALDEHQGAADIEHRAHVSRETSPGDQGAADIEHQGAADIEHQGEQ